VIDKLKVLSVDHIGIAVSDIAKAMNFYSNGLGLKLGEIEEIKDRQLRVGFIDTGSAKIELIEPTSDDSTVAEFISRRGEGIHHICFKVDNLVKALQHMKNNGFDLIDNKPRDGAGGSKIAFVHPKSAGGVLIELKELPK